VKLLIEQLEAGHSEGLTAYLTVMGRFHNYSFGNILEIARQKPDATRVAGMYAWNQLGRKVIKGQKGYHLARQRIVDNQFPIARGANSHRQIWEKFENDPDPRCQKLYLTAKKIQDKRKQADYDIPYSKIEGEFPAVIEMAQRFAQDLNRLDQRLPVNRGVKSSANIRGQSATD
jgi:hypothetical protein